MSSPSVTRNRFPYPNEPIWSKPERAIARKAFDAALNREVQDVTREAKQMANKIKVPADVWALERYLTQRRRDIDRKYEFRSSRLTQILGMLLSERRILEEELRGLREDKIKAIRTCAELLWEDARIRILSAMACLRHSSCQTSASQRELSPRIATMSTALWGVYDYEVGMFIQMLRIGTTVTGETACAQSASPFTLSRALPETSRVAPNN